MDSSKFAPEVLTHLDGKIEIRPYQAIFDEVRTLGEKTRAVGSTSEDRPSTSSDPPRKLMISNRASWALSLELGGEEAVEEVRSPIGDAKAIKNETEIAGMKACHVRDGAALTSYFAWVEDRLLNDPSNKSGSFNEVEAADQLEHLRALNPHYQGLSFDTISAVGPNAAVIHYKPERETALTLDASQIYLCDSGAQYLDGTTDVTRTFHFMTPTAFQKRAYTLVLKGVLDLAAAVFPKGTTGFALDAFARRALWADGLDYRHGTGHGVGSFLNVHEGPVGIGTRVAYAEVGLNAGNVLSDEPGFYLDGRWGIRIENLVVVKDIPVPGEPKVVDTTDADAATAPATTTNHPENEEVEVAIRDDGPGNSRAEAKTAAREDSSPAAAPSDQQPSGQQARDWEARPEKKADGDDTDDRKPFLTFETITMVPYCRALIETSLLTPDQRRAVDAYHREVRAKVGPLLRERGDEVGGKWLVRETEPL